MNAVAPALPAPKRRSLSVLDSVQIAQPCPAEWEAMRPVGGHAFERVRHCESCNLRVYNLSAMARVDAEALLRASEGRLCVRLYRRHDGTVLTADCSYLRRAIDVTTAGARRVGWALACAFAAMIGGGVWAAGVMRDGRAGNASQTNIVQSGLDQLCQVRPIAWVLDLIRPVPIPGNGVPGQMAPLMGDVALPAVPMGAPGELGQVAVPQSGWINGGRGAPTLQGEVYVPPVSPVPPTDPKSWLQIDEPPRPPL